MLWDEREIVPASSGGNQYIRPTNNQSNPNKSTLSEGNKINDRYIEL